MARIRGARALAFLSLLIVASPGSARNGPDDNNGVLEQLELRSIFAIGGDPQFSLHDPVRDMNFWIALNETRHGVKITDYEADKERVVVHYGDRSRKLGLSDSEIAPLENAGSDSQKSSPQRTDRRNPEERMKHILETWEKQVDENQRLREIDEHLNEYYREFQEVRQGMWNTTDHDSPEFRELAERRRELRNEMQVLNQLTQKEIMENEAFEEIDHGALWATLRHRYIRENANETE